jgi:gluconate 2-dehydrogenase gamma chain
MSSEITRREALKRAAWMLGGTLSAPTILGVLAGCGHERNLSWTPRTLTPDQHNAVNTIAEIIIPETDTPGARSAGVDQFIDAMLTDYYPLTERERFLSGLGRLDARAEQAHGKGFNQLSAKQQQAMVLEMDRVAFSDRPPKEAPSFGAEAAITASKSDVATGQGVGANPKEAAAPPPDPEEVGPKSFFRNMKELAVVGYYTSEVGQTRELRLTPWGRYRGDVPYKAGTPSWA